jgi:hypothetical protein
MVEKKATARPGQGFGRNPSAGVTKRGLGLTVHFRARNSFQQRQLKKPRCLTIASAVILLPQSGGRRGGYVKITQKAPASHRTAAAK